MFSLELVDPRFYHLDVALAVLDSDRDHIAYYPPAFSPASQARLATRFPDAVIADDADAYAFGLNAVGDGRHVFMPTGAVHPARPALRCAGYTPGRDRPQRNCCWAAAASSAAPRRSAPSRKEDRS